MEIRRTSLADCEDVLGVAVAIDVLRAFTTAAYAFQAGVREILVTSQVQEALALRDRFPEALLLGEIDGVQISGFDLGNSPSRLPGVELSGKRIIMRTTAGTQGLVRPWKARRRLAAGLCNATATADALLRAGEQDITLIQTGVIAGGWGDEDRACADWLEARLRGLPRDARLTQERVCRSRSGGHYDGTRPDFPPADLEMANQVDCFGFVMEAFQEHDLIVLRRFLVDEEVKDG